MSIAPCASVPDVDDAVDIDGRFNCLVVRSERQRGLATFNAPVKVVSAANCAYPTP